MVTGQDFRDVFSGDDNKISGKRVLGTFCILAAIILTAIASFYDKGDLAGHTLLISPLFASGLTFWGIVAGENYMTTKMIKENETEVEIAKTETNEEV